MLKYLAIFFFGLLTGCATTQDADKAVLHQRLGLGYYEQGNFPLALKEFLVARDLDPKNPAIHNNIGLTYFMRERYDLSEQSVRKALSLSPQFTDARNNLGRILIETGKYEEAEKELGLVLNDLTYPGHDKAYLNMGLLNFNRGKYDKSLQNFSNSLKLNKDSCSANTYLGRSYFELKNYEKAAEVLDNAIGYCQKEMFDEPHYFSALTYYRLGNVDRAKARFEEIMKLYPQGQYRDKSRAMLELLKKDFK